MTYKIVRKLGEGTYATIFLAKKDQNLYAIKTIKNTEFSDGQEISSIRELKVYKKLKSKHILEMVDVFISKENIDFRTEIENNKNNRAEDGRYLKIENPEVEIYNLNIVMEYLDFDLDKLIKCSSIIFLKNDVKNIMFMILEGLSMFHRNGIIHRDLKPANILVKKNGIVKIGDFGLAREIGGKMTPQSMTLWYRPPELLMGAKSYGPKSDMFAVGLIFAELLLRVPLFAAESDLGQLSLIVKVLGFQEWEGIEALPGYLDFSQSDSRKKQKLEGAEETLETEKMNFEYLFSGLEKNGIDLLKKLLSFSPAERISSGEALRHSYFQDMKWSTPLQRISEEELNVLSEYP